MDAAIKAIIDQGAVGGILVLCIFAMIWMAAILRGRIEKGEKRCEEDGRSMRREIAGLRQRQDDEHADMIEMYRQALGNSTTAINRTNVALEKIAKVLDDEATTRHARKAA